MIRYKSIEATNVMFSPSEWIGLRAEAGRSSRLRGASGIQPDYVNREFAEKAAQYCFLRAVIEPLTFYLALLFDVSGRRGWRYLFHFRPGRLKTSE